MKFNFKNIIIGQLIEARLNELNISTERICNFLKLKEQDVLEIYRSSSINTETLLKVSKLLEYDFFRIYSNHMVLYAPPASINYKENNRKTKVLPIFNKSVYTRELIEFIID